MQLFKLLNKRLAEKEYVEGRLFATLCSLPNIAIGEDVRLLSETLTGAYQDTDLDIFAHPFMKVGHSCVQALDFADCTGSTCTSVLVTESHIAVANIGRSTMFICRGGDVYFQTRDHHARLRTEATRIKRSSRSRIESGEVALRYQNTIRTRPLPNLPVTRAFGDFAYKRDYARDRNEQAVISLPDVEVVERSDEDDFCLVASDGLWVVMTVEEVCEFVHDGLTNRELSGWQCVQELLSEAYENRRAKDNITIILAVL